MSAVLDRPFADERVLVPVVDDATRRELLVGALAVALVGCGEDGDDAPEETRRSVRTGRGTVQLPVRPQRVACADFYGAFQVVDLGLTPVGISGGAGSLEPYRSRLKNVSKVGDYTEPDVERIAAVRPDVILRTIDTDDELYRRLTALAPTVEVSFQQLSLTEVTRRVGDALNRGRQATELTRRYEERAAAIRRAHRGVLATTRWTSVSPAEQGQWFLTSAAWTDNAVLMAAGVRLARAAAAQREPAKPYSLERLGMIDDADVLVVPATEDGEVDPTMSEIVASDVWKRLPAVRAGHVYALPPGTSSLGMAFPLLDALEDVLARLS